jgi:hypothetical protein
VDESRSTVAREWAEVPATIQRDLNARQFDTARQQASQFIDRHPQSAPVGVRTQQNQ